MKNAFHNEIVEALEEYEVALDEERARDLAWQKPGKNDDDTTRQRAYRALRIARSASTTALACVVDAITKTRYLEPMLNGIRNAEYSRGAADAIS